MCGIAGHLGSNKISVENGSNALRLLSHRGPDFSGRNTLSLSGKIELSLLHTRLSIIDREERSNQPFDINGYLLVFNGEIYNYLEIKGRLISQGYKFRTNSDTEVLLQSYIAYGDKCVDLFEGMWAFAIWDPINRKLFLSRDRFGEKPLYFIHNSNDFYFSSETRALRCLNPKASEINLKQINRYLFQGYKALNKSKENFWTGIQEVAPGQCISVSMHNHVTSYKYWSPVVKVNTMLSEVDAINGVRDHLLDSVKIRLRSDVPLAFSLSGGVDSASILSIAVKKFGSNATAFSVVDTDDRYDESKNINSVIDELGIPSHKIYIDKKNTFENLSRLIEYHDAPLATMTSYVHSMLCQNINENGFKVVMGGTAADEIFTGYYDHFLLHLQQMYKEGSYEEFHKPWKKYILPYVRSPYLRNPKLYIDSPFQRDHIYDHSQILSVAMKYKWEEKFSETEYKTESMLRNRMLNELFSEVTPVILHEEDLNSMLYGIESRNPFLDTKLFEFAYSIPDSYLIKNGYAKNILREAMSGILNEKIRCDRVKKGFNASINTLFDLSDKRLKEFLFYENSKIDDLINWDIVLPWLNIQDTPNHLGKFIFNLINLKIFTKIK